jgi:RNA polymerase sigma factor (sigma-70 family)
MQEVYVRVLMLKSSERIQCPKAYLYRVAANIAHQYRSDRDTGPRWVPFEESAEILTSLVGSSRGTAPEAEVELSERLEDLTQRLDSLPTKVQSALLWHYRDGYTCEEIGARLAIRRNRVKKYIAKAMARCRAPREGVN